MSDAVLVTGACGLVGRATVKHLAGRGRRVVATDLGTPANRKSAAALPSGVAVRWVDLTNPAQVAELLAAVQPAAVIHLAAIIPPMCYGQPMLARKVNVEATSTLVKTVAEQQSRPRFVYASSIAVYGPRNPHRISDVLRADTPVNPYDLYGQHKLESEQIVQTSGLDWVVLRLGGVLSVEVRLDTDPDLIRFGAVLPSDGRLQTVDVRDVAHAFGVATTAEVVGRILLIGGDDSHRLIQSEVGASTAAAIGLVGALPRGRPGDPDNDEAWFATDWMDSTVAQAILGHQHHSWPQMLAETAESVGWRRYPLRLIAPLAHEYLKRQSPYYRQPGSYAHPWDAVRRRWGAPEADRRIL